MRAIFDPAMGDAPAGAIPVSPVKIDLAALRAPLVTRSDRLRFAASLALCLLLHGALLLLLEPSPQVTSVEEAIPVEVIIEPAPEEAQPEPEKAEKAEEPPPEKPAQVIEEKPANDFARTADQDREDGKASDQPAAETKEPEAAQPEQQAAIEPPPPAPDLAPEPVPEPVPEPPLPPPTPKPAPSRFAGFKPLPDLQFKEPLAKRSDMPAGTAQPGYLSTLYGLIMRKMPALPRQGRPARGRVTFGVLSNGHIFQEAIAIPSGAPFLDGAALAAVRKASPFPPPPKGGPVYIRFDYGSD